MSRTKRKTVQKFGARKRAMQLVRPSSVRYSAGSADYVGASTSTSSVSEIAGPSSCCEPVPSSVNGPSTIHLRTRFLTKEEIDANAKRRDALRAELCSMPATRKKFQLMEPTLTPAATPTSEGEHFSIVQMDVFSSLLRCTVCRYCLEGGLTVRESTKLGLATKLEVVCPSCGTIESLWSSPRKKDTQAFEVNVRAMMAMKQIGKGQMALNDFWAAMNVSYRGLHHKTFQKHLKETFREPEAHALDTFYANSAAAVISAYKEMDPSFCKDITVVYDGTWHKRGHTSHIGVGSVIDFHTGLILDAVVLSNHCLGCQTGPKPGDVAYDKWHQYHICQKNTDAKSGSMEVEAGLTLFKRSISRHGLRYTTLVSDGDSRTFSVLTDENVYGIVPIAKEECLNHVQKRMGSGLRNIVKKSDKPLSGKGKLTKHLIENLTDYYGWALRNNSSDVAAMQRAVMATYHHVTSTDRDPRHELCPEGAESWCRHKAAEAKGEPQPRHKHNLPDYVAAAMLPVYQRLSQKSLLQRCMGAKTQNASESFHSVLWSLMPKEQHASLIAVETALHEAVLRYNAGCLKATEVISVSIGLQPGHLAIQRALEKDVLRLKKNTKRHQEKVEVRQNKKRVHRDTSSYPAGAF
ncbi:uncharacterized protein [Dermacentor albipictus]|uniref:uncharacterized protein n=1 Tax=Dermacentor albipictus TaxID=60249 RepID=UPI0038FCD2F4